MASAIAQRCVAGKLQKLRAKISSLPHALRDMTTREICPGDECCTMTYDCAVSVCETKLLLGE